MEMLIVVAIIVALAGIGGFFLLGQLSQPRKTSLARRSPVTLTQACQSYYIKNKQWPQSLQILINRDPLNGNSPTWKLRMR